MNVKTGKKDIIIDVHSDDDTLPHEHEKAHRKLVEQLIGNGVISAAEVGEVTVKRGGKAPPPLKGREEPPAGEKAAISTRRRRNPLNKDDFEVANERRLDLIHKSIDGELTADEEVELEKLQKLTAEYINRQHPLPFDRLAELEEKVRKYQKPRRNPRGACKKRKTRSDKGKSRKKYKRRGRK